jgi:hypothetical protein
MEISRELKQILLYYFTILAVLFGAAGARWGWVIATAGLLCLCAVSGAMVATLVIREEKKHGKRSHLAF